MFFQAGLIGAAIGADRRSIQKGQPGWEPVLPDLRSADLIIVAA
jgi:hypothetical protein